MRLTTVALAILLSLTARAGVTGEIKLYPHATAYTPPDTEQTRQWQSALRPGTKITAYLTGDPLDKVVAFYKGAGREYVAPGKRALEVLPNGRPIKKVFVILDGAPDLIQSSSWISIQHPFVGEVLRKGATTEYRDVRDVTEIVVTEKQSVNKAKQGKKPIVPRPG